METTIECLKEEVQQVLTTNILPYWIEKMQDRGNGGETLLLKYPFAAASTP